MFLHFGYFLQKGVFPQKGFLSADILSFCRNAPVFLQKAFGLSVFLQKPTFLQKSTSFCRNQPLSAETNLFLQKGRSFCQFLLSAETFCFLYPLFWFRPISFRLISNLTQAIKKLSFSISMSLVCPSCTTYSNMLRGICTVVYQETK